MKTKSILARHPLGLILELIGLVSVAIMLGKPVALAQVGPSSVIAWGAPQDIAVPADYDGDGRPDIAVYRQGIWFIIRSSDGVQTTVDWGGGNAIPVPADYDGDGKADVAVYSEGVWFISQSSAGGFLNTVTWGGLLSDVPVPADYNGDGKADIAVYRDGTWLILFSVDVDPCFGYCSW